MSVVLNGTPMLMQLFLLAVLPCSWLCVSAQLSSPIASNSHVSVDGNKFLQREADRHDTKWRCAPCLCLVAIAGCRSSSGMGTTSTTNMSLWRQRPLRVSSHASMSPARRTGAAAAPPSSARASGVSACRTGEPDEQQAGDCPQNVQLKWMAETTSSVYATPLITDLHADGFKDIIVPSFVHNLEVFQGDNGAQAAGFPAFHSDRVHASPLMFDVDHDGVQDIVVATYSGEILFYQDTGQLLPLKFTVPRLPVKRCVAVARLCTTVCASVWGAWTMSDARRSLASSETRSVACTFTGRRLGSKLSCSAQ